MGSACVMPCGAEDMLTSRACLHNVGRERALLSSKKLFYIKRSLPLQEFYKLGDDDRENNNSCFTKGSSERNNNAGITLKGKGTFGVEIAWT